MEYRDYSCGAGCDYNVTISQWNNTGVTRAKADGTVCDDGAFCTFPDVCSGGVCSGAPHSGSNKDRNGCIHNNGNDHQCQNSFNQGKPLSFHCV